MADTNTPDRLDEIVERGRGIAVRELLRLFGAERRGYRVVAQIRHALDARGLVTDPDFDSVHIDAHVKVLRGAHAELPSPELVDSSAAELADPVQRIGRLVDTDRKLVTVRPGTSVLEASTIMMMRDFSQLPVLRTEHDCLGMVSWRSIGTAAALQRGCVVVDDCMEPVETFEFDAPLFHAMQRLRQVDAILVRDSEARVSGIVTTADISVQFHMLGEPFLLLGEIENHLRILIDRSLTPTEIAAGRDPSETTREVTSAADLTFGEYKRMLERAQLWERVGLPIDRGAFIRELEAIRLLRNEVMHFDPDGIADEDLRRLREFADFVRRIVSARPLRATRGRAAGGT